jgi:hypothetical protein
MMPRTSWHASLADPPAGETDLRHRFRHSSRRTRVLVSALLAIVGVAVILGAGAVFVRWRYGTWPLAAHPDSLHYCGRTYDRLGEGPVPTVFDRAAAKDVTEPISPAFTYRAPLVPSHAVFADIAKGGHVGDSLACAGELFIETGPDRVIIYQIIGDT